MAGSTSYWFGAAHRARHDRHRRRLGIGKLAAAAAEGIARQPSAADQITGAVNLPLFLLEGVAILAEVFGCSSCSSSRSARGQRIPRRRRHE